MTISSRHSHPSNVQDLPLSEPAESSLRAPALPVVAVNRTALVNRLRADRPPVVVLTAPAGYGKTTLLAQWSRRDERPFAWLSVGRGDDHPVTFLRGLVEALGRVVPVDESITAPLASRPLRARTVVRRLGAWLLERSEPLVLVIDNVEQVQVAETVEILATLCAHMPPVAQLVLSGRGVPPLPLARLRAQGRLAELGQADLRMTDREAVKLLRAAAPELDEDEIHALNARAEGWPTGLALAAQALEPRRGRPVRASGGIDGAHHFLAEFFESEVLARLDPADAEFATRASLLERMSGPACDRVLGTRGCGERLLRLARAGAFIVPLDREHRRFRFERFFRDALHARLEQLEPERYDDLNRRAAVWAEREGDVVAALDFLCAVGDRDEAARLLGEAAGAVVGGGLLLPLEGTLPDLADQELLAEHRPAAVVGAFAHALLGHPDAAARWASATDAGPADPSVATLRAARCRDGVERMREDAVRGLQGRLAPFARVLLGVAELLRGREQEAEEALEEAAAEADGAALTQATALAELSLLAQARSEWSRAEDLARAARDAAEPLDEHDNALCALVFVASARSALRNSNWVRVSADMSAAQALLPHVTDALPWLSAQVRLELARTHLALNDLAAVRELLDDLDVLLVAHPHLGVVQGEVQQLRAEVERRQAQAGSTTSLTAAELRLLPLLTTHLTFRQIADHLYVSRNTIKTQAISVYRKLGVTSRTEAIDRAVELGFLRPPGEVVEHRYVIPTGR